MAEKWPKIVENGFKRDKTKWLFKIVKKKKKKEQRKKI
jgi:hypothetical protein